ncbi:MAG: biotin-dependent carboxyltransferase family protein [Actinomycetota bacterium]|nr:biotin-dependent carboxyltransferase family protein [Actinomycetota bacterium]
MLEVIAPGPLTTIQDLGRPGWAHLGISRSGAADRGSLRLANRLAGNPEHAAALEATLQGPRLRAIDDLLVVLAGAPCRAQVDGREVEMHTPIPIRAGQELGVGRAGRGVRTYVAFAGGLGGAAVLGSRSTDTLGGLGPAPLAVGDRLAVLDRTGAPAAVDAVPVAEPEAEIEVALLLGPREDWFAPELVAGLRDRRYTVGAASDRVGIRLQGEPLEWARAGELRSEGIVPGAVQVPPAGQPIVLMADHPTTGGYPVLGVVAEGDLDRVAQLRPGAGLRFRPLPMTLG